MKKQNISIAILVTSAVVLSVLLVLLPAHAPVANATMSTSANDYILLTCDSGGLGSDEYINVIDTRNLKMIVYAVKNDHINPINALDINRAFAH